MGSIFAGIGGFDLAARIVGIEAAWQVEIDPFRRAVLERRFPNALRYDDVREIDATRLPRADIVTAGWPCQDLSISGRRAGLAGERSGLFWEVVRIAAVLRCPVGPRYRALGDAVPVATWVLRRILKCEGAST